MSKKLKISLIVLLAFIIIAVIALIVLRKNKNETDISDITPTPTQNAEESATSTITDSVTATAVATDWRAYQNKQYKFGLSFSNIWQGYQVVTNQNLPKGATASIGFSFKTTDSKYKGSATALTVYVFPQDTFDSLSSEFSSTKIISANNLTYSYRGWEESPSDRTALTDKAIADVIKTFKVIN